MADDVTAPPSIDALLPCPFCGGGAIISTINAAGRWEWFGECEDCMAEAGHHYSEAEAAKAWNRRAAPDMSRKPDIFDTSAEHVKEVAPAETVIQADRDAAASFLESWEPGPEMTVVKLARAFADHRRATLAPAAPVEGMVERGFDAAIRAVRAWGAGVYSAQAKKWLHAVAADLEANRETILATLDKPQGVGDNG